MREIMTVLTNDVALGDLTDLIKTRLSQIFSSYLIKIPSLELKTAMEYSLANGGKRIRPLLVYATGATFNAPLENLDIAAAAIELIHTYSLIHDDLPCMDNADLRRGQPASHKAFGEGMAVLAGDAMQTLAMQLLTSQPAALKAEKRVQMLRVLSEAAGPYGMVGGQALDITLMDDAALSNDLLLNIYHLKTGALFTASIQLGQLASNDDDEFNQKALYEFGERLGLAFQIQDDIVDIESASETSGKPQGIDAKNNKITYPKLHGVKASKLKVESLYEEALTAINYLGTQAQLLRELAKRLLDRKN